MKNFERVKWCDFEGLSIPPDYDSIFRNRTVFLTGMGRSGTTILGRIIGSLDPVFYVHEPHVLRFIPLLCAANPNLHEQMSGVLKALIFEDFILQIVHGRSVNFNTLDLSYIGNYDSPDKVKERWGKFRRRADVTDFLDSHKVLFVIKIPDIQPLLNILRGIFPSALFVHIMRSPNDVINSALYRREWYTDSYLNNNYLNWVRNVSAHSCRVPWFLGKESAACFGKWSPATRVACVWRHLNEKGLEFCNKYPEISMQLKYEEFVGHINSHLGKILRFIGGNFNTDLTVTDITDTAIKSVANYNYQKYDSLINQIEDPEIEKFNNFVKKLEYVV